MIEMIELDDARKATPPPSSPPVKLFTFFLLYPPLYQTDRAGKRKKEWEER